MSLEKYIRDHKNAFDDKKMPSEATPVFEQMLKKELHPEKKKKKFPVKYLAMAAGFALLVSLGFFYNQKLEREKQQRDYMLTAMSDETASGRLQAVYEYEDAYKKEDDRLLKKLIELLHKDDNINVKIAAIDALIKFPNNEEVRLELIKALETEKEPLVQLKLIKTLTILREERAKEPLKQIIEDKQTFPVVKGNATLAMNKLKN
ncbi:hypothetical protein GWK08_13025 [Leptobacterium flavescens]|uniref:HEAT repeat domain-containing protein n=1 Tax=Leptobacterium flavescens TaxID=472055 RepID=A0A6P0URG4_9FLAO|nr:HEAT repeat domain-containing protein [Leptobacterium flavescens]NER14369.1 hypothetical protein [Leptobacterium flavescens]